MCLLLDLVDHSYQSPKKETLVVVDEDIEEREIVDEVVDDIDEKVATEDLEGETEVVDELTMVRKIDEISDDRDLEMTEKSQ